MKCVLLVLLFSSFQLSTANLCLNNGHELIGDRCYAFVTEKLNFWQALQYCYSYTGTYSTLATVDNIIQSNFLASLGGSYFDTNTGSFWIGAYRDSYTDNFRWTDGSRFSYSNFDRGYPTSLDYVAESVINGKWRTISDTERLPFVCSYYAFGPSTGATEAPVTQTTEYPTTTDCYWPWYGCYQSTTVEEISTTSGI